MRFYPLGFFQNLSCPVAECALRHRKTRCTTPRMDAQAPKHNLRGATSEFTGQESLIFSSPFPQKKPSRAQVTGKCVYTEATHELIRVWPRLWTSIIKRHQCRTPIPVPRKLVSSLLQTAITAVECSFNMGVHVLSDLLTPGWMKREDGCGFCNIRLRITNHPSNSTATTTNVGAEP